MKAAHVSKVSIDILYKDIVHIRTLKHPGVTAVTLATSVTINGTDYKKDRMMIVHGSCGDLPEFSKITQLCIIKEDLSLIVKTFSSRYWEPTRHWLDLEQVARALVAKHPCLENQGTGYSGWKISLGTIMNN